MVFGHLHNYIVYMLWNEATKWLVSDKSLLYVFSLVWRFMSWDHSIPILLKIANVRLFIHHDITQAPNSVLTMVQSIGFYDRTYVYVMVNSKLPLYVSSQCSGHSVEYFLGNIDIYDCF